MQHAAPPSVLKDALRGTPVILHHIDFTHRFGHRGCLTRADPIRTLSKDGGARPQEERKVRGQKMRRVLVMGILTSMLTACAGERPANLGVKDGLLAACPSSPNCVASRAVDQQHRIEPFCFSGDPYSAFARLKRLLLLRDDTKLVEENEHYLRVEFRTRLGFVDDGEFLLNPGGRCIQLRSASRLGYSDLGKNRGRLEEIRLLFAGMEQET